MEAKIVTAALLALAPSPVHAQFNTIRRSVSEGFEILTKGKGLALDSDTHSIDSISEVTLDRTISSFETDTIRPQDSQNFGLRKKHLGLEGAGIINLGNITSCDPTVCQPLPELTVANLLEEIRKNGIQHEKIVLAQAILETGWFTSSVCRNKNNLFGLTNPRTGQYYEFNHWTESVRAYRDKVQYRYKGGNYLLWLREIGYAEDPRYVSSLIRILRQYML